MQFDFFLNFIDNLLNTCFLQSELRMEDLRKAKFLNGFVSRQPISSMIVLRWIDAVIHHESEGMDELPLYYFQQSRNLKAVGKNSGKGFALLPVLLQFIVTTVKNYPLQRQDAYALLVVREAYSITETI